MPARSTLVLIHRYVGLAIALFLINIGVTGALLAYFEPLTEWFASDLYESPGRGPVLDYDQIVARAQAQEPTARIDGYPPEVRAGHSMVFEVSGATGYNTLWVDPVTAQVLARTDTTSIPPTRNTVMNFVYTLHMNLAIPGSWGTWILGIAALLWFFDCFVGAILTFPQGQPFFSRWKPAWKVKSSRLNYDTHRAGGLWMWGLLATLALSGVQFNLPQIYEPVVNWFSPPVVEATPERTPRTEAEQHAPKISAGDAWRIADQESHRLGWVAEPSYMYRRFEDGIWQVYFRNSPKQWATAGSYGLFIDDKTGVVVSVRKPGGTGGDVFSEWLSALHTGTVFGWPYKILLCLVGLTTAVLSITGVVIWWRKRRVYARS